MPQKTPSRVRLPQTYIAEVEAAISNAIAVAEELISVTEEETRRLSSGRPEAIEELVARKKKLASDFEEFLQKYKAERNLFMLASDERFEALQVKTNHLAKILIENTDHLKRAMTANERRIETIMRAIREQQTSVSPYGANGVQRHQGQAPISMHTGHKA
ncbi:flagellar export chaperone FlgN [Labrenzia sp. PHM005]|uniref:flagellar export chaperone FlgN n=1 Tax=Labrenzia sp. PHM005 TaxID=2590016 RepID=UPI00113FD636|nr:flagellar export chaperone FlgN [Labrenzia sp. PHM005]QDG76091.1 flagellar protein FlgN [Labrenzia sp. PHM005]